MSTDKSADSKLPLKMRKQRAGDSKEVAKALAWKRHDQVSQLLISSQAVKR